uniref:Uncharacterized protein n=1 Tax=Cairina moschata TaxID=8855 RepID=A0A8C3C8T5_CAIMO
WGSRLSPCGDFTHGWDELYQTTSPIKKSRALAGRASHPPRLKLLHHVSNPWEEPCNSSTRLGSTTGARSKPLSMNLPLSHLQCHLYPHCIARLLGMLRDAGLQAKRWREKLPRLSARIAQCLLLGWFLVVSSLPNSS